MVPSLQSTMMITAAILYCQSKLNITPPNMLTGAPQERPKKKIFCRENRKCVESLNGKNEEKEEEEEEEEDDKEEKEVILNIHITSRKRNVGENEKKLPDREGHG